MAKSPSTDRKLIEQLIGAYIRAQNEFNFAGAEAIRNQLKLLGISLFDETPEKGKIVTKTWNPSK